MFKDKTLLITGGTGSFGKAVLERMCKEPLREIRIFSRDEKKQDDMRRAYRDDRLVYYIGDVRDISSVTNAVYGVDYIFHAAALKQVPSCEFFPMEAVKTNIMGTDNVLTAGINAGVKKIICLSTDKAAYPVNAMGASKSLMEKVFISKSRTVDSKKTLICGTRYGNVLASRGSVIPLFVEQLKAGNPLTVTDLQMTRFIMSLDEALDLVIFAFNNANSGDIMVQKAPACTIETLAMAICEIFNVPYNYAIIGIRHGEKKYEALLTYEEASVAKDLGGFYCVPADYRDLNYDKYFIEGDAKRNTISDFNSDNTAQLSKEAVIEKLMTLKYIKNELASWQNGR